ncbi:MAG: peptidoglycan-associated lipoprotein Pal [Rhodospirillaceae bacterium]|nr:peptidoglycan-associated lipoprotein Pal [Rhodospirillales bacterium]
MRRIVVSFTALAALMAVSACSDETQQSGGAAGSGSTQGYQQPRGAVGQGALTEAERLAQLQKEFQTAVGDRVYFGTDAVSVTGEGRSILDRQVAFLRRYPTISLRIEGHADERGTREYNLALGDRRAQSVREYLLAQGVSASRLQTTTYGKERPEAVGAGESAWSKNRRAVSVIAQ